MSLKTLEATKLCFVYVCSALQQLLPSRYAHTNMQTHGKIHRNSLPKLATEIMRTIVPIPSLFPVKSKFSLLQDSGKDHPYKR